jgi:dTDP-4-amino-4,6-dideoxygalactose transaminase
VKNKRPAILGGTPAFEAIVPITSPTMPAEDLLVKEYQKIIKSGMITNGAKVREFEEQVKRYIGVKHAIALSNCTSGLMLIMKALGLTGEVILPSFTFHATAHAAVWNGLDLVFVDCDAKTYNLDPEAVEKAITPRTSAIIGVHVFGNPADIDRLENIAKKHKLKLIFDAAHGFGTKYQGRKAGVFGDAESFSLSPTKLLTAGEGGVVTTNNDGLASLIRAGRNYGDTGDYNPAFSGLSARMSEFHALLGLETLKMLDVNVSKRKTAVELYKKELGQLPGLSFQTINEGNQSSYKDFSVDIDPAKFGISRDDLAEALTAENIVVKKYFYPPVHRQKAFARYAVPANKLVNTDRIASRALSLPLYSHIESSTVLKIIEAVKNIQIAGKEMLDKKGAA